MTSLSVAAHHHHGCHRIIYRGAYVIQGLVLNKTNANVHTPFLTIPEVDLSVEWKQLFHGHLVGKVVVHDPRVNFVSGPTPQQRQTGQHKNWRQQLVKLFPFTINRFQVNNATLHFKDPHRNPPVDLSVTHLYATATNLSNVRNENIRLPGGLIARGQTIGGGSLDLALHLNPVARTPTFKLIAGVTNVDLTALNNFMRAYGGFDVRGGTFALYVDVAAAGGKYQGYFKPFFFDLDILSLKARTHHNIFRDVWEVILSGISQLIRNQRYNQLATQVPISGSFQQGTSVDLWATIGNILRNAFVQALLPKVRRPTVPLPAPSGSSTNAPAKTPQEAPDKNPSPLEAPKYKGSG